MQKQQSEIKLLVRISAAFKEALFPNKCSVCGRFFHPEVFETPQPSFSSPFSADIYEYIMTPFLCSSCRAQFYPIESPKCIRCGEMFKSRTGSDHICEKCLTQKTHFDCIRSAGQYDGSLMALIHRFKYKRKMQLARPLGRLLFHAFVSYSELPVPDVIVPVPLHPSQIKKRGFNQASLILNQWAAFFPESGCPCPDIAYDGKILKRIKNTHSQTSLSREQRRLNIREAFSLKADSQVTGKTVLLIDDVCTTGATVNECAAILKNGGAVCVNVLTLARAA